MAVQTIYRIQNSAGEGPYVNESCCILEWQDCYHNDLERAPAPWLSQSWQDLCTKINTDPLLFGFELIDQVARWFTPTEIERLTRLGFTLVEVQGEVMWRDGHQVAFRKAA